MYFKYLNKCHLLSWSLTDEMEENYQYFVHGILQVPSLCILFDFYRKCIGRKKSKLNFRNLAKQLVYEAIMPGAVDQEKGLRHKWLL